ncbi:hypothetical protein [Streptomyces justiciae]|uniref:DUF5753 domain-containing protein n=1 Tax=Streptomyces justiciae TaxID=2780140 RepID=A0ABU3LVQ4_9ACTN|nr:hypothetical protein [Streptomyces justiciae]MDT7843317.1 hypothetical protein [Streptomyces justiciae]
MLSTSIGVVLDAGQPGAVLRAHPMDVLAAGTHRDVDILLSAASDEMGWWVANTTETFDPHTVEAVADEIAAWRNPPHPGPEDRRRLRP